MKRPLIFMFSGQGSQYYQMGRDLYDQHAVFRSVMNQGDQILRSVLHRSIIDELFQHPISKEFNDLNISHPALILVEHAVYQVLLSEGIRPDYVWGSSAGEFAAAIAAGVFDLETGLLLAAEQARVTARFCDKGGMVAVLADPELYHRIDELKNFTTLAGINFSKNFIVSGNANGLARAISYLSQNQLVYQTLPVGYAFHSPGIDALKEPFLDICSKMEPFGTPQIPFISSLKAGSINYMDQDYFWQVARGPIQFYQTFLDFAHKDDGVFIDCGPSGSLATFIKYSAAQESGAAFFPLLTPYQRSAKHLAVIKEQLNSSA